MVGQNNKDSLEELSFGKIGKNKSREKFASKYALFHLKTVPEWTNVDLVGQLSYDALVGYIRGAYFGKFAEDLLLYNGVSEETNDGSYLNIKFFPLDEAELKQLIEDAEIPSRFNIKTIK